ncbi:delta 1-pyrroline-5-carboxylate reductase [Lodderomyces elongisporus]|uniref:delta 1-pyrroline-5-carboxylate reductase n=1 Tax=Lodderomyces elongisporus TaxID=36914 RepID=UPI00292294F5|nr:delta 1-pyrroline-5-carboxylate reductase [Lodderomyces elongisporus]WLF80249.1 delta 1-pyrroline-5-carboxylate reductase [Lodderomyces elongisporus]
MALEEFTLTVLGAGVMGTAVSSAILNSSVKPYPKKVILCTPQPTDTLKETFDKFDNVEYSFTAEGNKKAVKEADIILLAVKPFMYQQVYDEVKDALTGDQLLISLLAGTTINELSIFTKNVAKVMTNTPARYGCGTAAIAFSPDVSQEQQELVKKLIEPVGLTVCIPEKNMDIATSLIGSGPAFCLLMMESMIDGAVRMGMPYDVARVSAAKVMEGTAKMLLETGDHPAALKSKVCTPGGTTIGGLLKMEDGALRSTIARGIEEAANISASFAKK